MRRALVRLADSRHAPVFRPEWLSALSHERERGASLQGKKAPT